MTARLRIPVQDERGGPLPGVAVVLSPIIEESILWWDGQFARIRRYGKTWSVAINSEWTADHINADPRVGRPSHPVIIEVWPSLEEYQAGQPPAASMDMRDTDGHWKVNYNLHFWTFLADL